MGKLLSLLLLLKDLADVPINTDHWSIEWDTSLVACRFHSSEVVKNVGSEEDKKTEQRYFITEKNFNGDSETVWDRSDIQHSHRDAVSTSDLSHVSHVSQTICSILSNDKWWVKTTRGTVRDTGIGFAWVLVSDGHRLAWVSKVRGTLWHLQVHCGTHSEGMPENDEDGWERVESPHVGFVVSAQTHQRKTNVWL